MDVQSENVIRKGRKALIAENKKYWEGHQCEVLNTDKWIYVNHSLSLNFEFAVHEDIIALGLQEKEHFPIAVVTNGHGAELLDELDASFGLKEVQHLFYSKFIDAESEQRTVAMAKQMTSFSYGKKDEFLQLIYRGIKFGDFVYDEILKKYAGEAFDCFDISEEQFCKQIRNALSTIDKAYEIFQDKPPVYIVTSEPLNTKGLFADVAYKLGAKILIASNAFPSVIMQFAPGKVSALEHYPTVFNHRIIEEYSKRNIIRLAENQSLFVQDGKKLEKDELLRKIGIENEKKNVFIFPHLINDSPRGSQIYFYHDYNEWFIDTLRIVNKIPDVNWIIKDHPLSSMGKQENYIKELFEEYKTETMFWCDRSIGGMWIKEIADCVVTCVGEAAMEYWAYGVPTITVGASYFLDWGISYNARTLAEYEDMLKNIDKLKRPPEESAQRAGGRLAALKQLAGDAMRDDFDVVFSNARKAQVEGYKAGEYYLQTPIFYKGYIECLKNGSIKSSPMFQLDNVYEA